jgi:hypothetical protein
MSAPDPKRTGCFSRFNRASYASWLAFLNTVRTERFDQVLALRPLLPTIAKAA